MADFRFDGIENLAECIPRQPVTLALTVKARRTSCPCDRDPD